MAKRRRKRRSRIGIPVVFALMLIMFMMIGLVAYGYINANRLRLPGNWYREIDITDQVKDSMEEYLGSATMGNEVDASLFMDKIVVTSEMVINKEGQMNESINRESYDMARAAADEALRSAVSSLLATRIQQNYIETDKSIDELVEETLGMSLSAYLKEYGPKLLPDYDELDGQYGMSADYEADREHMNISGTECDYAVASGMLVINYKDGAVVYHNKAVAEDKGNDQADSEVVLEIEELEGM